MSISSNIRGLHNYEKECGKIGAGSVCVISLAVDYKYKENHGAYSIQAFTAEGQLCGHIAREDAEKISCILENGLWMNARVPTGAKRRGGKMGKEISVNIFY